MINYVLGFATDGQQIVLIRKNKPDYMKGKLNGIGGKIEQSERQQGTHRHDHEDNPQITAGFCLFRDILVHFSASAPNPLLHDNPILAG